MKRRWVTATVIDALVLLVSLGFVIRLNTQPSYGVEALTDMGRFVVWYSVLQVTLIIALVLAVQALLVYIRRRRK